MDESLIRSWLSYRDVASSLYVADDDGSRTLSPDTDPGDLETLTERSGDLLEVLSGLLADGESGPEEREELETAAYAAAAVDVTIGADVLVTFIGADGPELGISESAARLAERGFLAPEEEPIPIEVLLIRATAALSEDATAGGAQPGDPVAMARARDAIDELVKDGAPVVRDFAGNLIMAGTGQLISAVGGLDWLRDRAQEIGGRLRHGMKLIELGLRKMAAIVGLDDALEAFSEMVLSRVQSMLETPTQPLGEAAVHRVVRAGGSWTKTAEALARRDSPPDERTLDASLDQLCAGFEKNMRWAKLINKGLSFGGVALVLIGGGPPGQIAVTGVVAVGLVVCLCNLADRLDTLPDGFGWVPGVPEIAETCA